MMKRPDRKSRRSLASDVAAAKAKLAAIPPELDKWEADIVALAAAKKDDTKPVAKKDDTKPAAKKDDKKPAAKK